MPIDTTGGDQIYTTHLIDTGVGIAVVIVYETTTATAAGTDISEIVSHNYIPADIEPCQPEPLDDYEPELNPNIPPYNKSRLSGHRRVNPEMPVDWG